jgi:hypothetical protein
MAQATSDPIIRARDLAVSCFYLLPHTPIRAVGINRSISYRVSDLKSFHRLGDTLAPKASWESLLGDEKDKRVGGLRAMTMERQLRPDNRPGFIRVLIQSIISPNFDFRVEINDHLQLNSEGEDSTAKVAAELIEELWLESISRSEKIAGSIRALCDG